MTRVLAGTIGAILIYVAFFLYEDEHGKLQNKLEEWWVRVSDLQTAAVSRVTALLQTMAAVATEVLDLLFGDNLISLRAFGASLCYSIFPYPFLSSLALLGIIPFGIKNTLEESPGLGRLLEVLGIYVLLFAELAVMAGGSAYLGYYIASVSDARKARRFVVIPVLLVGTVSVFVAGKWFFVVLMLSYACDVAFVAFARLALRRCVGINHPLKIAGIVSLSGLLALCISAAPLLPLGMDRLFHLRRYPTTLSVLNATNSVVFFNLIDLIVAVVFVFVGIAMLSHRIFWPVVARPLYVFQDLGIARRRKLLAALGITLLGYAGIGQGSWLRQIATLLSP